MGFSRLFGPVRKIISLYHTITETLILRHNCRSLFAPSWRDKHFGNDVRADDTEHQNLFHPADTSVRRVIPYILGGVTFQWSCRLSACYSPCVETMQCSPTPSNR